MFGNRIWRIIFGPKREKVVGGWMRLHNEELCNLYASPNNIRVFRSRRMKCVGHIAHKEEMRKTYRILFGKPGGKTMQKTWV
jgi:hypothetical protein